MTYGEYWVSIKMSMQLVDGKWVFQKPTKNMPSRMDRDEASKYYNKKFNDYWNKNYKKSKLT